MKKNNGKYLMGFFTLPSLLSLVFSLVWVWRQKQLSFEETTLHTSTHRTSNTAHKMANGMVWWWRCYYAWKLESTEGGEEENVSWEGTGWGHHFQTIEFVLSEGKENAASFSAWKEKDEEGKRKRNLLFWLLSFLFVFHTVLTVFPPLRLPSLLVLGL